MVILFHRPYFRLRIILAWRESEVGGNVDLKPPLPIIHLNLDNSNSPQLELSFLSFDKKNSKKFTPIIRILILVTPLGFQLFYNLLLYYQLLLK